ncbi:MAG TPA: hypothetical protein VFJ18_04775 [Pararhizobium sp.]|nr:hypothetical protein [Pararhizobium sp.]
MSLLVFSGCTSAGEVTPVENSVVLSSSDQKGDALLKDGQTVLLVMTEGVGSTKMGSRGKGRFVQTYRAASQTFGPAKVTKHTDVSLTFRTRHDTCVMTADHDLNCENAGTGYWKTM